LVSESDSQAIDQVVLGEGLTQEADRPGIEYASANAFLWKGRHKYHRCVQTSGYQQSLQFGSA
jgi:hypothetical protein